MVARGGNGGQRSLSVLLIVPRAISRTTNGWVGRDGDGVKRHDGVGCRGHLTGVHACFNGNGLHCDGITNQDSASIYDRGCGRFASIQSVVDSGTFRSAGDFHILCNIVISFDGAEYRGGNCTHQGEVGHILTVVIDNEGVFSVGGDRNSILCPVGEDVARGGSGDEGGSLSIEIVSIAIHRTAVGRIGHAVDGIAIP